MSLLTLSKRILGKGDKSSEKVKKGSSDIKTLSAGEYVDQEVERVEEEKTEAQKHDHDHDPAKEEDTSVEAKPTKEMEAYQKNKAMQQGGNKKKTHRRKSIG